MTEAVRTTTGDTFYSDVTTADRPVLVDFYADWCGPCKALQPIVENVVLEFADRLDVMKVDVDQDRELAAKYGIRSIPTLLLFKNGTPVETIIGLTNESNLAKTLSEHV